MGRSAQEPRRQIHSHRRSKHWQTPALKHDLKAHHIQNPPSKPLLHAAQQELAGSSKHLGADNRPEYFEIRYATKMERPSLVALAKAVKHGR